MGKFAKGLAVCIMLAAVLWTGSLMADKRKLSSQLIRLHVVGASDSGEDQAVKLRVRDAVVEYLNTNMVDIDDADEAKSYVTEQLTEIQKAANAALEALGVEPTAVATFCQEEFGKRVYDSFTLPSGVYDSLRITIGPGEGKNWWCVVFPTLCYSATAEELESVAAGAGFSESLTGAITGEEDYELRFYFLDLLGKLENFVHR